MHPCRQPQDLAALRTTKLIQSLGRQAIYSNNPYVDTAFESLVYGGGSIATQAMLPNLAAEPRRTSGRVPRPGAKAAAIRRAKRLVSQHAPFKPQVPFEDAVRACGSARDRGAIPALLDAYIISQPQLSGAKLEMYSEVLAAQPPTVQLQAVALLIQHGFHFAAVKVVYGDRELLRATLEEMKMIVVQHLNEQDAQVAVETWNWKVRVCARARSCTCRCHRATGHLCGRSLEMLLCHHHHTHLPAPVCAC